MSFLRKFGLNGQERRKKIAIISTYDDLCGIAGYTRALERQLRPHVDLEVFDLDQYYMRSKYAKIQRLADIEIKRIAARLHEFDSVNIQLEHGTLGVTTKQIIRRFRILTNAAPHLSVTFHTVMIGDPNLFGVIWNTLASRNFLNLGKVIDVELKSRIMDRGIQGHLRRLQSRKPVSLILHTKRDMRLMRDLYRLKNVHHHPLAFVSFEEAVAIRAQTSRRGLPVVEGLPETAKLIGTFGFLSPYKGFETAIQALQILPEDHHLLIFGGIHPQGIQREQTINPYIKKLLRLARIGHTAVDHLKEADMKIGSVSDFKEMLGQHPNSLQGRVHFMGALTDAEFCAVMALCDATVFPYMEVGQSSSGPITIAVEMGARVIASRTNAFRSLGRYHEGKIEYFDIGNYAELATRIAARGINGGKIPELSHNTLTNTRLYLQACGVADAPEAADLPMSVETASPPAPAIGGAVDVLASGDAA